jgi:hypothetical protein
VIFGGSGGVGTLAVQFATFRDARVLGIGSVKMASRCCTVSVPMLPWTDSTGISRPRFRGSHRRV